MKIFDLNQLEQDSVAETDLCIIGAGPAGLSIANEFVGSSIRVLVLESGGLTEEPETQALYEIESTGAPRVMNQENIRCRILGGSSHIWTGRCAPFDVLDFKQRPWIPYSGWPVTLADLEPSLDRAGVNLGLGPNLYDDRLWQHFKVKQPLPPLQDSSLRPVFWQFSKSSTGRGSAHFGRDLVNAEAPNIEILLHANVTQINVSPVGKRFESVVVSTLNGKRARIRSRAAVLCCGGIENARLLLASSRVLPKGVGNQNDLVGRFLMDHTNGTVGYFEPREAAALRSRFGHYWVDDARGRHVYLHGLGLSEHEQEREQLLNCHSYLEASAPVENDPWAALKRLSSSVRSRRVSVRDAQLVAAHLGEIGTGLGRRLGHRPQLEMVKWVELHCMLEQMPDPDSRVMLSDTKKDALGMPISRLHWKVSDAERQTARHMVRLVGEEFSRMGLPVPRGVPELDEQSEWISRCVEKAHPTGTTRMAVNPKEGVVDPNCEVHAVRGLFIAGSSIFPTSGAANPTLMIVAMALRVADYLKSQRFTGTETIASDNGRSLRDRYEKRDRKTSSHKPVRVGFVGAGRRISEIYLPIVEQMCDQFDVVGFTAFSPQSFRKFESTTGIQSFPNAAKLVEEGSPELLILAVPDRMNERTITSLLDFKLPILAETPLAWSASGVQRIIEKAAANGVLVGVAEQFPFLPLEQFRKQLLERGILGDVYAVLNDFQSYSYHGIAQMRSYLKGKPVCCRCTEFNFSRPQMNGLNADWLTGSVSYDDGTLLLHNFAAPDRGFSRSTRLYGSLGSIDNDTIHLTTGKAGQTVAIDVVREASPGGQLASISADLGEAGPVRWDNPFAAYLLSDEQIAVASILMGMRRAIREGAPPLYGVSDFLADIEIVQAFRYSAGRNGANVRLPFIEWKQKILQVASASHWKRKMFQR